MKKNVFLLVACGFSVLSFAQVGIKKDNPHASTDLELGSSNKTLLLNRVANTNAVPNPVNGMMVYDQSEECVKAYQSGKWTKCLGKGLNSKSAKSSSDSFSLSCTSATLAPSLKAGQAYKGVLSIPYTNGTGNTYGEQIIRVNGLTAMLSAGKLTTGNGAVQYSVTGKPDRTDVTFNVHIEGSTCSVAAK